MDPLNYREGIFYVLIDTQNSSEKGRVLGMSCHELLTSHIAAHGAAGLFEQLEKITNEIRTIEGQLRDPAPISFSEIPPGGKVDFSGVQKFQPQDFLWKKQGDKWIIHRPK